MANADAWPERTRERALAAALDCSAFLGAIADAILAQTPFVGENEHKAVLAVVGYLIGCESAWRWLVEGEGVVPPIEIRSQLVPVVDRTTHTVPADTFVGIVIPVLTRALRATA